jgi:glycosyltransferase involved in cell wall biosynthesis
VLRVTAYTSGQNDPSARFRIRQYIPALRTLGIELRERPSYFGSYPPAGRAMRPLWAAAAMGERALSVARSYESDVTLLQRSMLSRLVTAEPLTRRPRVLDVDDAIWLGRGRSTAPRLAQLCDLVICGNDHLAQYFRQWNSNVAVLPTAVDTDVFHPVAFMPTDRPSIIGWSGSSSGFRYLDLLTPALKTVLERHRDVTFRVVSDQRPKLDGIPESQFEFVRWSPETEVRVIQEMTVGVMPVEDTPWGRGKCGFKMLTYMACGVPAVASPIGMNADLLAAGGGLAAGSREDWIAALDELLADKDQARRVGEKGREIVARGYSLIVLAPRLAKLLACFKRRAR